MTCKVTLPATAVATRRSRVSTEDRLVQIQSSVIFGDILHFAMLPDEKTDEDWGVDGIERILDAHVDAGLEAAKGFFRRMDGIMQGDDETVVAITDGGDVVDIRIRRGGREILNCQNLFIFYESNTLSSLRTDV
jgi:hypothetical protein